MKTLRRAALCLLALAATIYPGPRYNKIYTVAAGTPIQLATVTTPANRVFIQMLTGGSGSGYVMDVSSYVAGTTPAHTTSGELVAQLCPATSTAPGCSYSDTAGSAPGSGAIDISKLWIDGSNSGDTLVVSYDLRN